MPYRLFRIVGCTTLLIAVTAIARPVAVALDDCASSFPNTLCFDLRHRTAAALVQNDADGKSHLIALPFGVERFEQSHSHFVAVGNYDRFAVISFIGTSDRTPVVVPMLPHIETEDTRVDKATLTRSLYILKNGLERTFLYRYPTTRDDFPKDLATAEQVRFSAIGLILPELHRKHGVPEVPTENPKSIYSNGYARFYPASDPKSEWLEVSYEIARTERQTLFAQYGSQTAIGVVTAIFGLIFIERDKNARPRARKIGIITLLIIEVVLVGGLVTESIRAAATDEIIAGSISALITAAMTIFALWVQSR